MSAIRIVACACVAAGLVTGSLAPARAPRPRVTLGGYELIAADFHVHSYPGDGTLPPSLLAVEAGRRGLDAIALTNHNRVWPVRVEAWLPRPSGAVVVLPGEEITTPHGHVAAVGVTAAVDWRQSIAGVARDVHAQGGVAIAAHPVRDIASGFDAAAIATLDGVEVAHPAMFQDARDREDLLAFFARASALHPGIAAIGSTDFHFAAPVGLCRTYLLVRARTAAGVLDAIRAGRTVACDARGEAYGARIDPVIRQACRDGAAAALDANTRLDAVAVLLVLAGLAVVVVL